MALRMRPEEEQQYLYNIRNSTQDDLNLANFLQRAAGIYRPDDFPAPVYLRQALYMREYGFSVISNTEAQEKQSAKEEQSDFLHDAVKTGRWSDNRRKKEGTR